MYYYSAYWRTWSRVLLTERTPERYRMVEVDLMPNPRCHSSTWDEVRAVRVRSHSTEPGKRDRFAEELPADVRAEMVEHLGEELTERLLTGEI